MFRTTISKLIAPLAIAILSATQADAQNHKCSESRLQRQQLQTLSSVAHQQRMHQYDVNFYKLDVSLERNSIYVAGGVTINATTTQADFDTFAFELHPNLTIDSIRVNGQLANAQRTGGDANVVLPNALPAGAPVSAIIYYHGTAPSGASAAIGNGLSTGSSPSWNRQVTWSLSQPFAAYEWWPCKQILTDKADSVHVFVTTSNENKVGSNGLLTAQVPLPNNKVRYEWKSSYPIAYYLISVAVSDYIEYTIYAHPAGSTDSVMIQNYIYSNPGTLPNFKADIDDTAPMLEYFSEEFGLYPFHTEKYGHSMAPFSGGMEHQTMTTQGFFEFTLTAHELGHQWFGDNVTCASWSDIWLNEGFASYSEYLALYHLKSPVTARNWMNSVHGSVMSQLGGSVYVADSTNVTRIFNSRLSYDKGAALVHMLRFEVNNDSLFFQILRQYQTQFGDSTARTSDLKNLFEVMTGRSFTDFFNQWFYGQGYPAITLRWNQLGDTLHLQANQGASMPSVTPVFKTPLELKLLFANGDTTIRVMLDQPVNMYLQSVASTVTGIQVDPNQWILNQLGGVFHDTSLGVTGVDDTDVSLSVKAFPNPFTNELYISEMPASGAKLIITDMLGRVMSEKTVTTSNDMVTLQHLPTGLYLLQILSEEGKQVIKIIKQ